MSSCAVFHLQLRLKPQELSRALEGQRFGFLGKKQAEQAASLPCSQADWCVYMHGGRFLSAVLQLLTNYHEVTNWN